MRRKDGKGGPEVGWVYLIAASFGEIFGVLGIKLYLQKRSPARLLLVVVTFGIGFLLLALAMRHIPLSTAYAVWTGIGVAGTVLMGILFFAESPDWKRLLFLGCIVAGAVGLKLIG